MPSAGLEKLNMIGATDAAPAVLFVSHGRLSSHYVQRSLFHVVARQGAEDKKFIYLENISLLAILHNVGLWGDLRLRM